MEFSAAATRGQLRSIARCMNNSWLKLKRGSRPWGGRATYRRHNVRGWVWQEWLLVGQAGAICMESRAVSVTLTTPRLGKVTPNLVYCRVDDRSHTLALVNKLVAKAMKRGLPWVVVWATSRRAP